MGALTTLAAVKDYLGVKTTGSDPLIPSLILRESGLVQTWLGRTFPVITRTNKRLNGTGNARLALPDTPILAVSALSVDGVSVSAAANSESTGYMFDDGCLYMIGSVFTKGLQNVVCSWTAGYQESETVVIPSGNAPAYTPSTGGTAMQVVSVYDETSSVALTAGDTTPSSGEYSFADGAFTFNTAQGGHEITMTYYYVPAPVEQAVIEMVALDLQQRTNIGVQSKSLAGETISFEKRGISESAMELLRPYKVYRPF